MKSNYEKKTLAAKFHLHQRQWKIRFNVIHT